VTERDRQSGDGDLVGDFQRWLMKSGTRGIGKGLTGQVRKTLGVRGPDRANVWETATTEPPPTDASDCVAWCPICRAARMTKESGPGVASHLSVAGDVVSSLAQDVLSAFDAAVTASPSKASRGPASRPATGNGSAQGKDSMPNGDVVTPEPPGDTTRGPDDRG